MEGLTGVAPPHARIQRERAGGDASGQSGGTMLAYNIVIGFLLLAPWGVLAVMVFGAVSLRAGCWLRHHGWPSWAHDCGVAPRA